MSDPNPLEACPRIGRFLARLTDKWSGMALVALEDGPQRFSELRRSLAGISQRMLTLTLKKLERDGLVRRTVTPSTPPRVDYDLTDLGRSICGPLRSLGGWYATNSDTIDAARSRYDGDTSPEAGSRPGVISPTAGRAGSVPMDGPFRSETRQVDGRS